MKVDKQQIEFHEKILFWYTFFMAYPGMLILGQNTSIFFFPVLIYSFYKRFGYIFRLDRLVILFIPYFTIGSILSVVNLYITDADPVSLARANAVLPNYIYWSILILFLVGQRDNIRMEVVGKAIFWGVTASAFHYFILQNTPLLSIPVLRRLTQNAFAFLIIIYSPIAVYYLAKRNPRLGLLFVFILSVLGFLSGSRSASILVLAESFAAYFLINRKTLRYVFLIVLIVGPMLAILNEVGAVESAIETLNPRAHNLLYNTENVIEQDRSYLTRRAMVEKGLKIYEEHPLFGIGLNNFTNYEAELEGNFEGAKYVINKKKINETSSHNSYINLLAEAGLLAFIPFILVILTTIVQLIFRASKLSGEDLSVTLGFLGLLLHFYFINAIVNVFAWFAIGLCIALVNRKNA
ncbi:O-antigen ligase family protein [Roseivirga sp. BDSF3-8]|uniref:O-antigen ligase family protein n=1 Tax=Roseivirga sp. BDSF3-8 TaxID=3241598 RepID=UPI0035317F3A